MFYSLVTCATIRLQIALHLLRIWFINWEAFVNVVTVEVTTVWWWCRTTTLI